MSIAPYTPETEDTTVILLEIVKNLFSAAWGELNEGFGTAYFMIQPSSGLVADGIIDHDGVLVVGWSKNVQEQVSELSRKFWELSERQWDKLGVVLDESTDYEAFTVDQYDETFDDEVFDPDHLDDLVIDMYNIAVA